MAEFKKKNEIEFTKAFILLNWPNSDSALKENSVESLSSAYKHTFESIGITKGKSGKITFRSNKHQNKHNIPFLHSAVAYKNKCFPKQNNSTKPNTVHILKNIQMLLQLITNTEYLINSIQLNKYLWFSQTE